MLENHLKSAVTRRRLRQGPAAPHVDAFVDWLHDHGYKPISITNVLRSLAAWTDWLVKKRSAETDFVLGYEACKNAIGKVPRVRYERGPNKNSLSAASVFIRFLREQGIVPLPALTSPVERWPLLGEFRSLMCQHRGVTEATLNTYQIVLVDLLEALGDDPSAYTAAALRLFVLERARPHGIWRAKSIAVAVRAFLRFCGATGKCAAGIEHAIPSFASWRLSSVPRFLAAEEVERVIDACTGEDANRLRDRAVILLLARLGLRASDVARLTLDDIDWRNGRVAVCGKARRHEWLPLPQEVGDAILLYLRDGRPQLDVPEAFTTVLAPYRPLTRASVTHLVRSALLRAGIRAPINGAHVLRHSAATAMLRQGASLAGIGAVLRHRSPRTTAHYAKVDFGLLSEIAQPWPEVS
jgi:site-specific recombinase XerD